MLPPCCHACLRRGIMSRPDRSLISCLRCTGPETDGFVTGETGTTPGPNGHIEVGHKREQGVQGTDLRHWTLFCFFYTCWATSISTSVGHAAYSSGPLTCCHPPACCTSVVTLSSFQMTAVDPRTDLPLLHCPHMMCRRWYATTTWAAHLPLRACSRCMSTRCAISPS